MTGPSETDSGGTRTETASDSSTPDTAPAQEHTAPSPAAPDGAVPRAGAPRPAASSADPGPGWGPGGSSGPADSGARATSDEPSTTVLPGGGATAAAAGATTAARRPPGARPAAARPAPRVEPRAAAGARPMTGRTRRARLSVRRVDPWSVFLFSLVASIFLGIALIVAVSVLYAVLSRLGVTTSLNELFAEVTGGSAVTDPLLTSSRIVGGAAVLSAVNIVFLTLLATLGSLLYNLCSSFTGGIELTLGERD